MLDDSARVAYYQAQNGYGERLTPKQHRRVNKKRRAQSPEAQLRRDAVTRRRMQEAAEKNRRRDLLRLRPAS